MQCFGHDEHPHLLTLEQYDVMLPAIIVDSANILDEL